MWSKPPEFVAAVDLGSNSFHMIVAQVKDGQLHVIDRLREMVRLAGGLDSRRALTDEASQRALACLERFGQRLRNMPQGTVRAVGTNTLRSARNSSAFLLEAQRALGHPIEVIAGIEEARLIYLGVAHSLAANDEQRLVVDIGGGSTEFIIGSGTEPLHKESLHMGCVSMSNAHFADGKITSKRFKHAIMDARLELKPIEKEFKQEGWHEAVGASGTFRSVGKVIEANGWSKAGITREGLDQLIEALLDAGDLAKLELAGLADERKAVFSGGVAIIKAAFDALDLDTMKISDGALREGLLYDLMGRIYQEDIRANSVNMLASRYHVDREQSARITTTLRHCIKQATLADEIDRDEALQWLEWAALLHEIGRDIAHSQYPKHSAYIIEHADLAGFSQQDQKLLAAMVRSQRRKFASKPFKQLVAPWDKSAISLAVILRLAVLLHRSRQHNPVPSFGFDQQQRKTIRVTFPAVWLENNPLSRADLEQEVAYLKSAGIELTVVGQ